jgi:hypothetical protein
MRRPALPALLIIVLAMVPPAAARMAVATPKATLVARGLGVTAQPSRLVFSSWGGVTIDRSKPPVKWPPKMQVNGLSEFAVEIAVADAPDHVEIRGWTGLRRNGIPAGEPEVEECSFPAASASSGSCIIYPIPGSDGTKWAIRFAPDRSLGSYYMATSASWSDSQIAWINSFEIRSP